jgi:glycosyltransferase involved in cell wall biosynthesis
MRPDCSRPLVIHFITHHSKEAAAWPFYTELRKLNGGRGIEVFADHVSLNYSRRWKLLAIGWPKLIVSAWRLASLSAKSSSKVDVVVFEEHLQFWSIFFAWLWHRLTKRTPFPRFVYLGFIFTKRGSRVLNFLRRAYFRILFRLIDMVIIYSEVERAILASLFQNSRILFYVAHYGIGDHATTRKHVELMRSNPVSKSCRSTLSIVSAGRSERDYATLVAALKLLDFSFECNVICDSLSEFPENLTSRNVKALRNCYGEAYTREIVNCDIVVIPLLDHEISAGQMVAMHALAGGKPVLITKTAVSIEYFGQCDSIRFIPFGNSIAIADEIRKMERELVSKDAFFEKSRGDFERYFSIDQYAVRIHKALHLAQFHNR